MSMRRMWAAVVIVVLASAVGAAVLVPSATADSGVQSTVDAWRRRANVPAVGVALGTADRLVTTVSGRDPTGLTPAAQFRVASITKPFVATVVLQLVEEGSLELSTPAGAIVDDLPVGGDATIGQLLGHTSGVPDYGTPDFSQGLVSQRDRRWSERAVLDTVPPDGRVFAAGDDWQYSNTNYVVLAEVIAAVTGESWAAAVRSRILDPLALRDTYVAGWERPRGAGLVDTAIFDLDNDGVFEDIEHGSWPSLETSEGAAGAMVSTAADIATFTRALFSGTLLDAASLRRMVAGSGFGRRFDDYGLGIEIRRPDFTTLVWGHGGFLPGYRAITWYVPRKDVVVTVLVNDSRADPSDLAQLLLQQVE